MTRFDCVEEAVAFCISQSGRGKKEIAHALYPHLSIDSATQRLNDALNGNKVQSLCFNEIIFIMMLCDSYEPLTFINESLGFEPPQKINATYYIEQIGAILKKLNDYLVIQDETNEIRKGSLKYPEYLERRNDKRHNLSSIEDLVLKTKL